MEFERIRIEPAYRKVAAALTERIVARKLRDGDPLPPELELARQFGVNRSTVREALRELESGGLLERRRGTKRMVVTRPEPSMVADGVSRALALHDVTFIDVWEALSVLEPPVAAAAAQRRNREDLRRLAATVALFANDQRESSRAVTHVGEFFAIVAEATHNPALRLAQQPLVQLLEPSLALMIDQITQARTRILAAQRQLLGAIEERDAEAASNWMEKHIRDFRRGYELAGIELRHPIAPAPERA